MPTFDNEIYIGTQAGGTGGMVKVSSLGESVSADVPPIAEGAASVDAAHRSALVSLGDGTEELNGWLQTTWHFNGLRGSQYDALAAYATAHSTRVYIRSLENDGKTWANYAAIMIWPVKPLRADPTASEDGPVFDIEIRFIQMVEQ